jgi:hypothetical protein
MPDLDQMYKELLELPRRQYFDLMRRVDFERRRAVERAEAEIPIRPGMSRDDFAHWIARRHFNVDRGIVRIFYLPTNAPEQEVRLLEVNDLAAIPEDAPIVAVDFMPDIAGVQFSLFVADVTPGQYRAIEEGTRSLPTGWSLEGAQEILPPNA